ncbi:MAG: SMI1/KNR4 family protein [Anaerolineaceae bacterium]|nr:SMI1/KNR4 family protein [Anaerolineaceae bacterium]
MSILSMISNTFSVDVKNPPATNEEIEQLRNFSPISLPKEYIDLVLDATEIEIKVNNVMYIRIWSPLGCIDMNEAYQIQKYIPKSLAIGDDEGGTALLYIEINNELGLYLCRFADPGIEEAEKIAPSLKDLLVNDIGVDVVTRRYT